MNMFSNEFVCGQTRKRLFTEDQHLVLDTLSLSLFLSLSFHFVRGGRKELRGSESRTKVKFGSQRAHRSQTVLIVPVTQKAKHS